MLSLVIPAHNEEGCIENTVTSFYSVLKSNNIPHEILVVNDNSKDNTEKILKELILKVPTLRYVNNTPPNGYGFAVRKGLDNFIGEYVAVVMADMSDDPKDLVEMYKEVLKGYDAIFGSRFIKGAKIFDYPKYKLILNRLGNNFIRLLFWEKHNDITNAFKLYKKSTIDGIRPLISNHFNLTAELPLKTIIRGYKYSVVPTNWTNRKAGVSKLKLRVMASRYLFTVFYCYLEKTLSMGDYKGK